MTQGLKFDEPLVEGIIRGRLNRFIMIVEVDGSILRCHCPATGRIGGIRMENIPCLLSRGGEGRKTPYTVEAISLDPPAKRGKSWIGINQGRANDHVGFFLKDGQLSKMADGEVRREVRLGSSRIDFLVGDTYIEVKTPLTHLPERKHLKHVKHARFNSFERLIKHYADLAKNLRGKKAIVSLCYLYDAEPFRAPPADKYNAKIREAVKAATKKGVENWQINMKISKKGVRLVRYFRLAMF